MKAIDLKIQDFETQTGVGNSPIVCWKYGYGNHRQTAYMINLALDGKEVFSTGKVFSSNQSARIFIEPYIEQQQYTYSVTVWDENDFSESSQEACFITGIKEWTAAWIGNRSPKPFLARNFFLYCRSSENTNCNTVLSVCASGQFEVRINGKHVGPYAYEGSQTDFNVHIHYSTYDIKEYLKEGENEIIIETANGWYLGDTADGRHFYTIDKGYTAFGKELAVTAQIRLGEKIIASDESWEVSKSPVVLANIYGSEDIDARIKAEWKKAELSLSNSPKGKIIPCDYPPPFRKKRFNAVSVDYEKKIYDFGQNTAGQFFLRIKGCYGQKVKLIPAEKLSTEGDIIPTTDTWSILTLSGGEDVFEQKFSLNGARWYKIEGAENAEILDFYIWSVTSSAKKSGDFYCSNKDYMAIYDLILNAIESNLNHLHTDCPTIEKLGWLEPNHLMARAVMYNKDVNTLWSKIAMDMRDAQYKAGEKDVDLSEKAHLYEEGLVPSIAPRYAKFLRDYGEGSFWDIISWGSSVLLAPFEQFIFYGNKEILRKNYTASSRYLDYLLRQYERNPQHFICTGLGDWGIEQNKGCDRENLETAFLYHNLDVMAKVSGILNKKAEKAFYDRKAEEILENYNKALLVTDGKTAYYRAYPDKVCGSQAEQALPLCFGMVPPYAEKAVQKTLISLCTDSPLKCGEIGLVYILRALSAAGRNDLIHKMITRKEHPSYLRFVKKGETSLPEFWRDDARSRNHDMMGHIMEWFFTDVAGIRSKDGFNTVSVSPRCTGWISEVDCIYDSVKGKIHIHVKDGKVEVQLPCNMTLV